MAWSESGGSQHAPLFDEGDHLVEPGQIDPDHIHTPGIYVKRIVQLINPVKRIEQRTSAEPGFAMCAWVTNGASRKTDSSS